ncbi:hypothetical protein BDZ45DRAFT_745475 [Acephala macrosclerotiorum]|nr:hypothetical protein BDZ45DRAFT_745475 [Acephala macrosclerotiorum]
MSNPTASSASSVQANGFQPFDRLPLELQIKVWENTGTPGVVEIRAIGPADQPTNEKPLAATRIFASTAAQANSSARDAISNPIPLHFEQYLGTAVRFDPAIDILYFPDIQTLSSFVSKFRERPAELRALNITRVAVQFTGIPQGDFRCVALDRDRHEHCTHARNRPFICNGIRSFGTLQHFYVVVHAQCSHGQEVLQNITAAMVAFRAKCVQIWQGLAAQGFQVNQWAVPAYTTCTKTALISTHL